MGLNGVEISLLLQVYWPAPLVPALCFNMLKYFV